MTRETASRLGVRSISDLASTSGDLTLGGPPECPDRPLCLVGLERTYGLRFHDFVPLDSAATISNALASGAIDVGVLFSTDGTIRQRHLVALADDRHLQPADNVVPILRDATLARLDAGVRRSLDRVSRALTTLDLRLLNARVEFEGSSPAEVANDWLTSHELPAPKATTAG